jgi:hypothetical protein
MLFFFNEKHFLSSGYNKDAMKITSAWIEMFRNGKRGVFSTEYRKP